MNRYHHPSSGEDSSAFTMQQIMQGIARFDDQTAVVFGETHVSYRDLTAQSNRLVNVLHSLGMRKGDRFAFLLPNSPLLLVCYIACAKSGLVAVPLSSRTGLGELALQLDDAEAKIVLFAGEYAELASETMTRVSSVEHWISESATPGALSYDELTRSVDNHDPGIDVGPDDPFSIMYTGGSTGVPKGAVQTQVAWGVSVAETVSRFGLTSGDRHAVVLPMTYSGWFTLAAQLMAGGTTYILPRWDPVAVANLIGEARLTYLHMIPTLLSDLLALDRIDEYDVHTVRLITLAGASISKEMYHRATEVFGPVLGVVYGMTEASAPVTYLVPQEVDEYSIGSVGRMSAHVEARIDDSDVRTRGFATGELLLRGKKITPGYLNRPKENANAFRDGWFCTGDIAYFDDDGLLHLAGRSKDMVKSGGINIYPKEVEEVVLQHEAVAEAVGVGVPDPRWGEALEIVAVLHDDRECTAAEIIALCRTTLAMHKVPKAVYFADHLPRTNIGKYDKPAIIAQIESGALTLDSSRG